MIARFTRVLLRVTEYYYYVTYASEENVGRCSLKNAFLAEISQNLNFVKFLRTPFLTEHLGWLLLAFQSE